MCDFGPSAQELALRQKQLESAEAALKAQEQANAQAQAAAAGESEQTRLANEARMRRLLASPFGATAPSFAPAAVGTRQLYGG